ncbi:hypothetical protein DPMN_048672 [Dreissena polymorpha]|uniref:Uncharacterized protein n=1 Tax=Dreissena polymorpha TaxID=45954 RepID=A0A9D4DC07_DREPO|nr:hypothetical protein DPMN_048672 [Dreissena polymorpha]
MGLMSYATSVNEDQSAHWRAVCSGAILFAIEIRISYGTSSGTVKLLTKLR